MKSFSLPSSLPIKPTLKRPHRCFAAALAVVLFLCFVQHHSIGWGVLLAARDPCKDYPKSDHVFVALKTGATELREKLPVHLRGALRCIPNFAVFSDLNENFHGLQIHDALDEVDVDIRANHKDFGIYRKLQERGASGIADEDLKSSGTNQNNGKFTNSAWVLDKWKFLPIVDRVLRMRPEAKWYIIVETDTYVAWPSLLRWLSTLDAAKPEYAGFPMAVGNNVFAYGGSGIVMSNSAAQKCSDHHLANLSDWNSLTDKDWCGDCVLGNIMREAGVPLRWSWPLSYGGSLAQAHPTDERDGRRLWCHPVVALHHMGPADIDDLWLFEREWSQRNPGHPLLYKDVFREYILPRLRPARQGWDNLSEDFVGGISTFEECESVCRTNSSCLQFSFVEKKCRISSKVRLGSRNNEKVGQGRSGWLLDRIKHALDEMAECNEPLWV
jgi:hypothetical protein